MFIHNTTTCDLSGSLYTTAGLIVLLSYHLLSRDNAENMHFFSSLALTLNEPEEGVAPTDSRLRPDQRLMEAGLWDEANIQKQRLEESQRLERKRREAHANQALEEGETKETNRSSDRVFQWRLQAAELRQSVWHHKNVSNVCVITLTASGGRPWFKPRYSFFCPLRILDVFLYYFFQIKMKVKNLQTKRCTVLWNVFQYYLNQKPAT